MLILRPKAEHALEILSISRCSSFCEWATIAASSAKSISQIRALRIFDFALSLERLNSLPSDRVCRSIPRACFEHQREEDAKKSRGQYTALFDTAPYVEGLREISVQLDNTLHVMTIWCSGVWVGIRSLVRSWKRLSRLTQVLFLTMLFKCVLFTFLSSDCIFTTLLNHYNCIFITRVYCLRR